MSNKVLDLCDVYVVHEEAVREIKPQVEKLTGMAELFKALSDDTRCKLLYALMLQELCVCDLSVILDTTPSNTSHHLRHLRVANLVNFRREGRTVYYSLNNKDLADIIKIRLRQFQ